MKKQLLMASAATLAALLILPGCNREASVSDVDRSEAVSLWFEKPNGPNTRVDITGPDDPNPGAGTWTEGDKIAVYVGGRGAGFYQINTLSDLAGDTGTATIYLASGQYRSNYAIYPADAAVQNHGGSADDVLVKYPDFYDFIDMSVEDMATFTPTPMLAVNKPGEDLHFYHVGGVLRLTLPNVPQSTTKIRVTFPESMKYSGTFKVNGIDAASDELTDVTLSPVGDDHGHVITIQIPPITTGSATLTFNIPIPNGSYSDTDRNYRVEVLQGDTVFAGTGEAVNWWEFLRAEGRAVALPPLEGMGTFAGRYIARNAYLARTTGSTVDPANMYVTSTDDMEVITRFSIETASTYYFTWSELGKIMKNDSEFDGRSSFNGSSIVIDGETYRVPSRDDYINIINGPRYGATVNGVPAVRYGKVKVDITPMRSVRLRVGTVFSGIDYLNCVVLFPDFGDFTIGDGSYTTFNSAGASFDSAPAISFAEFKRLSSGDEGCVFVPAAGLYTGTNWRDAGVVGYFQSSTMYNAAGQINVLRIASDNVGVAGSIPQEYRFPVRLIRE